MTRTIVEHGVCDPRAAADLLRALAHPMRLQILCRLQKGELTVAGFESELGLKQPSLSQQLALLRDARLVATRRAAKSVFYRLADDRVQVLLAALREAIGSAPRAATARSSVVRRPQPQRVQRVSAAGNWQTECGVFPTVGVAATQAGRP